MKRIARLVYIKILFFQSFLIFGQSYAERIEWVTTFGGIQNESIDHVLICPNNDIIVIGTFSDSLFFKSGSNNVDTLICENEFEDVFIVKFKSHGTFLWATSLAHGSESFDWWLFPSVDSDGNLFLGGTFIGGITIAKNKHNEAIFNSPEVNSLDIFLTRILDDGEMDWAIKLGDEEQEQLWDIASDSEGSVYLTGRFWGNSTVLPGGMNDDIILTGNETAYSIFTTKFDNNGDIYWANKILNEYDMLSYSIAVSKSGKVSIAGYFSNDIIFNSESNIDTLSVNGNTDIFIASYDSNGDYLWSVSEGGSDYDMAMDLAFDSQENIIVTGYFQRMIIMASLDTLHSNNSMFEDYDDILLAKYDLDGNYLWSVAEGGPLHDGGERIQIFKNDKILLSGYYWNEATFSKGKNNTKTISNIADTSSHFAAKYTPDGILFWVADVDSSFSTFNTNLAIDSSENIIRAGQYYGDINLQSEENSVPISSYGGVDLYLAKFSNSISSITDDNISVTNFKLNQNFPNPFNPVTKITFSISKSVLTNLTVYNSLGQKVKTLLNEHKNIGNHQIEFDASSLSSGVYFYRLLAGSFLQVKKMLLIK